MTRVGEPLACSMAWSCDGNDSDGANPYPAVALAPSATICAEPPRMVAKKATAATRMIQAILLLMRLFQRCGDMYMIGNAANDVSIQSPRRRSQARPA